MMKVFIAHHKVCCLWILNTTINKFDIFCPNLNVAQGFSMK